MNCLSLHINSIWNIAEGRRNGTLPLIIFFGYSKNIADFLNIHIIILIEIRVFLEILQCNVHLHLWNRYSPQWTLNLSKFRSYFTFAIRSISLITAYLNHFLSNENLTFFSCCDLCETLLTGRVPFKISFINLDFNLGLGSTLKYVLEL